MKVIVFAFGSKRKIVSGWRWEIPLSRTFFLFFPVGIGIPRCLFTRELYRS